MSTTTLAPQAADESLGDSIQQQIAVIVDDLIARLPNPEILSSEQRRGIVARYTSVLEGNFIYWMTATSIATRSDEVRPILGENLFEEVRRTSSDDAPVRRSRTRIPYGQGRAFSGRRADRGSPFSGQAAGGSVGADHGLL